MQAIIQRAAVDKYAIPNAGKWPTQEWVNQELKKEGCDISVLYPPRWCEGGGTAMRVASRDVHLEDTDIDARPCDVGVDISKRVRGFDFQAHDSSPWL
jgi:hypothetical protein